jgi:hypothetical protein
MSAKPVKKKKAGGKPFTGADDPRRFKGGRPPDAESITHWLRTFGPMTPVALAELITTWADQLKEGGDKANFFQLTAARLWMNSVNDGDPRTVEIIQNRLEGKVKDELEVQGSVEIEGLDRMLAKVYGRASKSNS